MTDIPEPGRDPARPADACSGQVRRLDLDWLRICAFALLILYHTGMFYVTWDWHVKSPRASDVIEPLMMLSSPWRLGLLFLVSGAATRFLSDRLAPAALAALHCSATIPLERRPRPPPAKCIPVSLARTTALPSGAMQTRLPSCCCAPQAHCFC